MPTALIGILSLAIGAGSAILQKRQADKIEDSQREQSAIQTAGEENKNRIARRNQVKRARIARARIAASADGSGVSGSSGEIGAQSALTSNFENSFAVQRQDKATSVGITGQQNRIASARSKSNSIQAWGNLFNQGLDCAEDEDLFK